MIYYNYFLALITIAIFTSCGFDCVNKKTGLHKSSKSIEQARENGVFKFEMVTNRNYFKIDEERYLNIKKSWVENKWMYECIDNHAVVKRSTNLQFVIDRDYARPESDSIYYTLGPNKQNSGTWLGGKLGFSFNGQDTITLNLLNEDKKILDSLKFWKKTIF